MLIMTVLPKVAFPQEAAPICVFAQNRLSAGDAGSGFLARPAARRAVPVPVYDEALRPQFHFSAATNWLNDPNGLVYYKGEYHLFFQYNEQGINWGPNTWGHAISRDLVHWKQIDHAIKPDADGWIWSGSAVVDARNTAGLKAGDEDTLVAIYTRGGGGKPVQQAIAYSNDRGRNWTKYTDNPVLGHIIDANRDPKVIWHEPTTKWIMALYLTGNDYALFASSDLKKWEKLCDVVVPGTGECPDFFPLSLDGNSARTKWIFWGGEGVYLVGSFDGVKFVPEQEACRSEYGSNGYAAQTWSDTPDGRRIQISWMRGGRYPAMPFNQQMSFPVELSLRSYREGMRICRVPVKELSSLYDKDHAWQDCVIKKGQRLVVPTHHDLFAISARVQLDSGKAIGAFIHGINMRYDLEKKMFNLLGRDILIEPVDGCLEFEVLVDRTSMELFAQGGKASASFCCLPEPRDMPLEFLAEGGDIKFISLRVHELQSAWTEEK
jgi:sucrose-6-phosphate hydrolase SacC (GH32 family)